MVRTNSNNYNHNNYNHNNNNNNAIPTLPTLPPRSTFIPSLNPELKVLYYI